jgi:Mn2+/Fe2+ NRAMP family transporter
VLAVRTHASFSDVARNTLVPHLQPGPVTSDLVFLIIAIVGTTIAPWQLFFQQSCVVALQVLAPKLVHL